MNSFKYSSKGPFKKYVTGLRGGGSSKIVKNTDKGREGSSKIVMSPLMRKFCDSLQNY